MKPSLPTLLSINGGYVDTAGFLALHGLFTAHVTGNFVTLGAALALGTSGAVAKLLALPVFCAVVIFARLLGGDLTRRNLPTLQIILTLKFLLLMLAALLAMLFGPFGDGDGWQAILTGMTLVAAMAIQTTAHRIHLGSAPPTTMMTGTTTQIMIDIADVVRGARPEEKGRHEDAACPHGRGRRRLCRGLRAGGGAFPVSRHGLFSSAAGSGARRNSDACRQDGAEAGLVLSPSIADIADLASFSRLASRLQLSNCTRRIEAGPRCPHVELEG